MITRTHDTITRSERVEHKAERPAGTGTQGIHRLPKKSHSKQIFKKHTHLQQ